ncbi:ABC transporter substrate-binding protein [Pontiella agarivorans]|uniref:Helical backbone metal receptor n=1 Tax=Pontiella agarivorans TaxID=3038953 RepID=A0ABU5MZS3_9BACT|nr:helical backbone metal receptor [Pontiella agarivorans]MDZ8119658.1 helical backbone metal receptor [Pontiella agarivorans]
MMKRIHFLICILGLIAGCSRQPPAGLNGVPERIISLAPDITETVYLLGLGDRLVGATSYCLWPEEAATIPRVGGFGQFNFEAIVTLKPDLVLLHHNYASEKGRLNDLGIPYLETYTEHIDDIINSVRAVGVACGVPKRAETLTTQMTDQISRIRKVDYTPRVLITFGGDATQIDQIYAFGSDCLHNELLELAGGTNVVENNLAFSTLSREAVIRLNPEIIIQMAPGTQPPENPVKTWSDYDGISAVKHNRIYVLTGDYTCIPGPRFTRILADFEKILGTYE